MYIIVGGRGRRGREERASAVFVRFLFELKFFYFLRRLTGPGFFLAILVIRHPRVFFRSTLTTTTTVVYLSVSSVSTGHEMVPTIILYTNIIIKRRLLGLVNHYKNVKS